MVQYLHFRILEFPLIILPYGTYVCLAYCSPPFPLRSRSGGQVCQSTCSFSASSGNESRMPLGSWLASPEPTLLPWIFCTQWSQVKVMYVYIYIHIYIYVHVYVCVCVYISSHHLCWLLIYIEFSNTAIPRAATPDPGARPPERTTSTCPRLSSVTVNYSSFIWMGFF